MRQVTRGVSAFLISVSTVLATLRHGWDDATTPQFAACVAINLGLYVWAAFGSESAYFVMRNGAARRMDRHEFEHELKSASEQMPQPLATRQAVGQQ